jgi:protease-4
MFKNNIRNITVLVMVIFTALLAAAPLAAQSGGFPALEPSDPASAVVEGYRAPLINPAAVAFGNSRGITYARPFDSAGLREEWELAFNGYGLAYGLRQTSADLYHSLTLAFPMFTNFYVGSTMTTPDWDFQTAQYTAGLLYRPLDALSIGGRGIFRKNIDPQSAVSAAVRPFAFTGLPDRLLTAGFELGLDRLEPSTYTVSVGSSPVEWLDFDLGYELSAGTLTASVALSLYNLKSGAGSSFDSALSPGTGRAFITAAPRPYTRPFKGQEEMLLQRYELDGPIPDARPATSFGGEFYFVPEQRTIWQVRRDLQRLKENPRIDGIAFINDHPNISLSTTLELISLLRDFKEAGKRVVFYQDYMSSVDYLLAAAVGDEVYLHPGGSIDFRGLAFSMPYLQRFLADFGVEIDNYRSHPYKSSYNFLTEPGMTAAEREALSMLLTSLQDDMLRLISEGRGSRLKVDLEQVADGGPYLVANRALEAGLVDGLLQKDRFREQLSERSAGGVSIREGMPAEPFRRDWSDDYTTRVAVINAVGTIHTGEGAPGSSIGAESTAAAIRAAREDWRVNGILLRVNSGGGSALASDMIARELKLAVSGERPIPVVVSMGATAASGGYYISVYADRIVAYPTTLTGSIGVVGIVPHIEELLKKEEISWDVVKKNESADLGAIYRELTPAEKEQLRGAIMHHYDRFVATVSEGREMKRAEVEEVAQGRIWSGRQAAERGLVDELGGLETALKALKEEMGTDQPLELADYTYRGVRAAVQLNTFSSQLLKAVQPAGFAPGAAGLPAELAGQLAGLSPTVRQAYLRLLNGTEGYHDYVLTIMPYTFPEVTE